MNAFMAFVRETLSPRVVHGKYDRMVDERLVQYNECHPPRNGKYYQSHVEANVRRKRNLKLRLT